MPHYLNSIDDDDDEVKKINKRLIPYDYTFYKIYKDGCESYIGSTVNLHKRKIKHKSNCNNQKSKKYNFPVYKHIRENGGYNTFEFEILDGRFCCKRDAEIYEGELIKIHKSTLNGHKNYSKVDKDNSKKQYENSDKRKHLKKEWQKKYRQKKKQEKNINNITINIQNLNINLP